MSIAQAPIYRNVSPIFVSLVPARRGNAVSKTRAVRCFASNASAMTIAKPQRLVAMKQREAVLQAARKMRIVSKASGAWRVAVQSAAARMIVSPIRKNPVVSEGVVVVSVMAIVRSDCPPATPMRSVSNALAMPIALLAFPAV
jgi:hypothetical protein